MGNLTSSDGSGAILPIEETKEKEPSNHSESHPSPALKTIPDVLLGRVTLFLSRADINNLSLLDRETHGIIEDLVTKPWPSKCPFVITKTRIESTFLPTMNVSCW